MCQTSHISLRPAYPPCPSFVPRLSLHLSLLSSSQTEPLQQEVCEEVPDCGRTLQGATAHRLLPQDGDETGH